MQLYLWNVDDRREEHISLKLPDGTYISYWPRNEKEKTFWKVGPAHTYKEDVIIEGRKPHHTLYLPDEMASVTKMKLWWCKYRTTFENNTSNSAEIIRQALLEGGILEPTKLSEDINAGNVFSWAHDCKKFFLGYYKPKVVLKSRETFKSSRAGHPIFTSVGASMIESFYKRQSSK